MILHKPWLCTKLPILFPKYNTDSGDWEVWLSVRKVAFASPVIIVEFTRAKHLQGQRFCIRRQDAERCEQTTNGRIAVYKVPFSKLENWDSAAEVASLAESMFDD